MVTETTFQKKKRRKYHRKLAILRYGTGATKLKPLDHGHHITNGNGHSRYGTDGNDHLWYGTDGNGPPWYGTVGTHQLR